MGAAHDVPVRSARDHVVDLLEIGDTYPLTDLNVVSDQLKVAFGATAKIPIEDAQKNVLYRLCDPGGTPLADAIEIEGGDTTLMIETPAVSENITYRILAKKKPAPGSALPEQPARLLEQGAPVQVGIDTGLAVEILQAPPLDPAATSARPADPRIVPYGSSVEIQVGKTQEGVEYSLVVDGKDMKEIQTGNLRAVLLSTEPMVEDALIQVRATKTFLASENRKSDIELLDASLSLKVTADRGLPVSVQPSPVVEYGQGATIVIGNTQRSAKYVVYIRPVPDADFLRGASPDGDHLVSAPENTGLQARRPERAGLEARRAGPFAASWPVPVGCARVNDAPAPGTGGELKVAVPGPIEDAVFVVQALKEHRIDPDDATSTIVTSAICVEQAALALVRPDPARPLVLRVPVSGALTGDSMQVSEGQSGVFYYFEAAQGAAIPLPAYFHKHDANDAAENKGIGQLAVEVDLAIPADPDARPTDRAKAFPRPPLLAIAPFATGTSLSIRAVKAQTSIEASAVQNTRIPAVPAMRADPPAVDAGSPATIRIESSDPKDSYLVTLEGKPVRPEIAGDNIGLTVITEPVNADSVFEVVVARPADKGPRVERVVRVVVLVKPDATLEVSAGTSPVSKGAGTDIVVQKSQPGVVYQLLSGKTAIGAPVAGTGLDIALPTGAISADTTFGISAARADDARIASVLQAQITVKLAPDAPDPAPSAAGAPDAGTPSTPGASSAGTSTPDAGTPGTGTPTS